MKTLIELTVWNWCYKLDTVDREHYGGYIIWSWPDYLMTRQKYNFTFLFKSWSWKNVGQNHSFNIGVNVLLECKFSLWFY